MSTMLPSGAQDDVQPARPAAGDPDPVSAAGDTLLDRVEIAGRDLATATRVAREHFGEVHLDGTAPDGRLDFRYTAVGGPRVDLRAAGLARELRGEVERLDGYVVAWFRDGEATVTLGSADRSTEVTVVPGRPVALPSTDPFRFRVPAGRQNLVHLDRSFLEDVATERHGGAARPVVFRTEVEPTPAAFVAWRSALAAAVPVISSPDASPLMRMESDLAVARAVLTAFSWHTEQVPEVFRTGRLARVRAAVEHLHENAHLPISPSVAATAVGLHTRTMQVAFQRYLGMSPTEYLRGVRLDRVRRDLVEHTPDTATVSDLARAWGFGNLGRFAMAYAERFGEKPSETLRRGQP